MVTIGKRPTEGRSQSGMYRLCFKASFISALINISTESSVATSSRNGLDEQPASLSAAVKHNVAIRSTLASSGWLTSQFWKCQKASYNLCFVSYSQECCKRRNF